MCSARRFAASMAKGSRQRTAWSAYRAEQDVPADSQTETFVAMKLQIDNWRWADVPFYLRTGKRLRSSQHAYGDPVPARAIRIIP